MERLHERGYLPILAETWIKYMLPVHFPDTVRIEVWVSELTRVTAWISFRFTSGRTGQLVARARQRGVFVTADTNRPYRLSEDDRRGFDAVYLPDEEA